MVLSAQQTAKIGTIDPATFDWATLEGTYKGRALITRLSYIPTLILQAPSPPAPAIELARQALLRLIPLVRETWDHILYVRIIQWLDLVKRPEALAASSSGGGSANGLGKALKGLGDLGGTHGEDAPGGGSAIADDAEDDDEDSAMDDPAKSLSGSFMREGKEEDGVPDLYWVETAREQQRKENARLDVELRGYLSNLIKESIRLTYLAFAQLALKSGDFESAMKHYNSTREYSTSPAHHVELGERLVEACLAFNRPALLPPHLSKLSSSLDRLHPPPSETSGLGGVGGSSGAGGGGAGGGGGGMIGAIRDAQAITQADLAESRDQALRAQRVRKTVSAKLRVGRAVHALYAGEWERAGREAGEVLEDGGLRGWEGVCISTSDLSLIAALCTLATVPRERVRRVLLDRNSFREGLADSHGWALDVVRGYMSAKYGRMAGLLRTAEPTLLLHPLLSPHLPALLQLIHTRSIIAYVSPYASVRLSSMAGAFGMDEAGMSARLEQLVEQGEIVGKLDGVDGILHLKQQEIRSELQSRVEATGKDVLDRSTGALLNMLIRQSNIIVDPRPDELKRSGSALPAGGRGKSGGPVGDMADPMFWEQVAGPKPGAYARPLAGGPGAEPFDADEDDEEDEEDNDEDGAEAGMELEL